ncbi:MAG: hypothetical protein ACOC1L_01235 [Bacillota bacterium]
MKKTLLLVIILIFGLSGCSKKNEDVENTYRDALAFFFNIEIQEAVPVPTPFDIDDVTIEEDTEWIAYKLELTKNNNDYFAELIYYSVTFSYPNQEPQDYVIIYAHNNLTGDFERFNFNELLVEFSQAVENELNGLETGLEQAGYTIGDSKTREGTFSQAESNDIINKLKES